MIIVPAPPPKRRGFASTWLPWLVLGALGFVVFVMVNFGGHDERARLSPETADILGKAIRARGLNCPAATHAYPQPDDAFGKVSKITCSNAVDFRFTWLAGERGFRAEPWR